MLIAFKKSQYISFLFVLTGVIFNVSPINDRSQDAVIEDSKRASLFYNILKNYENSHIGFITQEQENEIKQQIQSEIATYKQLQLAQDPDENKKLYSQSLTQELQDLQKYRQKIQEERAQIRNARIQLNSTSVLTGLASIGVFLYKSVLPATAACIKYVLGNIDKKTGTEIFANSAYSVPIALGIAGIAIALDKGNHALRPMQETKEVYADALGIAIASIEEELKKIENVAKD